MSTAVLSGFFGVLRRGGRDQHLDRSAAEADAPAARARRPHRGRRRHQRHCQHGRRGRRVHDGSVHGRVQCSDAQLRRDVGRDRLARCRNGERRIRLRRPPRAGLPPHTLGYVHVPALLVIVAASIVSAPFGARAAHRWPVKVLKRVFAIVLYALAGYMLWRLWAA
jgi:hypothetical protein